MNVGVPGRPTRGFPGTLTQLSYGAPRPLAGPRVAMAGAARPTSRGLLAMRSTPHGGLLPDLAHAMSYVDPEQANLDAFVEHAKAHDLMPDPIQDGLMLRDRQAKVMVTCRPHEAAGSRLWFFVEPGRAPLAAADQLMNTIVAIKGRLAAGPL